MKRVSDINLLLLSLLFISLSIAIACRIKASWQDNIKESLPSLTIKVFLDKAAQ